MIQKQTDLLIDTKHQGQIAINTLTILSTANSSIDFSQILASQKSSNVSI